MHTKSAKEVNGTFLTRLDRSIEPDELAVTSKRRYLTRKGRLPHPSLPQPFYQVSARLDHNVQRRAAVPVA